MPKSIDYPDVIVATYPIATDARVDIHRAAPALAVASPEQGRAEP